MLLSSCPRSVGYVRILAGAVACALIGATSFAAETPKPVAPVAQAQVQAPVPVEPATTTASFGDWLLRCQRLPEGSKPARVCEVAETIQVQGQQGPFAQIAIGRIGADKPLSVSVVLPANVSFPSVVQLGSKDRSQDLVWLRCTQGGCFAGSALADDVLKVWRAATDQGKLTFKDASGRDLSVPISFKGLPQALDALAKEQ